MNSSRCLMRNMVKTMNDFSELLKQDSETVHEYDDERLVSTLRYTSLSHSLREEPNSEDFKNDNQWLFKENDEFGNIRVINFDRIPEMCNCSGVNTCDAFFYDYNGTSRSYLIEFKNCSRDELQRKYLKTDSSDSILKKVIGSRNILCSELNFEGKYTSSDLISNTHVIIVYNGKKTVPLRKIPLSSISKQKSDGRRPANVNFRKSYITNLVRQHDEDLFNEFQYTTNLIKILPGNKPEAVDIDDKIKLEYASFNKTFEGQIFLNDKPVVFVPHDSVAPKKQEKKDTLQSIIDKVNERFGGKFTDTDRVIVEGIYQMFMNDTEVKKFRKYAKDNSTEMFVNSLFPDKFKEIVTQCFLNNNESFDKLFNDPEFYSKVQDAMAKEIYKSLRKE